MAIQEILFHHNNMRAYITAPFKREENQTKIKEICDIVKQSGLEDFCFVRDMQKFESAFSDAQILMRMAKEEVMKCDILFIEASEKTTTGCTIETGMAYAMGKKIVTIAKF